MQALAIKSHRIRLLLMLIPAICLGMLASCDDDEVCEKATANNLRIGFYPAGQEEEFWVSIDSLRVLTLEKPEEPVYDTLFSVSSLELPLNHHADNSTFIFDYFHTRDTLWIHYERETHLISVECGFTVFYELQDMDYTTHFIEALEINEPDVTNSLDEHVKIFVPDTIPGN